MMRYFSKTSGGLVSTKPGIWRSTDTCDTALCLIDELKEMSMTDTTARGAGPALRDHTLADGPAPSRRQRMSAKRWQTAVLRLLRGEDLELVSRVALA